MAENQNTEWKESWRDEYLKWICGFANAQGDLLTQNGKDYIEICVNPSSYPVNYKGEYHYRSGSTKQLLRGAAKRSYDRRRSEYE